jgi:hypothetical protein
MLIKANTPTHSQERVNNVKEVVKHVLPLLSVYLVFQVNFCRIRFVIRIVIKVISSHCSSSLVKNVLINLIIVKLVAIPNVLLVFLVFL